MLISYTSANFNASVSLSEADQDYYMETIDNVLDAYVRREWQNNVAYKFPIIHERIENALERSWLSNEIIFFLEYLQWYVADRIDMNIEESEEDNDNSSTNSSSNANSSSSNTSSSTNISPTTYEEWAKNIRMWELSDLVVKYEVVANLEDIIVEEYSVVANSSSLQEIIEIIYIYNEDGELIDSGRPRNGIVTFNEEFTLERWDNDLYLAFLPREEQENNMQEEFTFTLELEELSSSTNWTEIDGFDVPNTEDTITITAATLTSWWIRLLESYNQWFVDKKMFSQARTDLAIISVEFTENDPDNDILMEELSLTLQDNTVAWDVHTTLQLTRIDSFSSSIDIDRKNWDIVTFNLSDLWSKRAVTNGSAVFLITWVPLLDSTTSESITIELNTSATENWIITYSTEEDSSIITTKSTYYLDQTSTTEY